MPSDYANTPHAQANRARKAHAMVAAAIWMGATDLHDLEDPDQQHAILAHAHAVDAMIPARASERTWALARQIRTDTRVHRLPPGTDPTVVRCGCQPHPVTGVLYLQMVRAFGTDAASTLGTGILCPHEDYRLAPAPEPVPAPAPSPADWAIYDDGSEPDWDSLIPAHWSA